MLKYAALLNFTFLKTRRKNLIVQQALKLLRFISFLILLPFMSWASMWDASMFSPAEIKVGLPGKVLVQQGRIGDDDKFKVTQETLGISVRLNEKVGILAQPLREKEKLDIRICGSVGAPVPILDVLKIETEGRAFPLRFYIPRGGDLIDTDPIDLDDLDAIVRPRWYGAWLWDSLPYYEYKPWLGKSLWGTCIALGVVKSILVPSAFIPPFTCFTPLNWFVGYQMGRLADHSYKKAVARFSTGQVVYRWLNEKPFKAELRRLLLTERNP